MHRLCLVEVAIGLTCSLRGMRERVVGAQISEVGHATRGDSVSSELVRMRQIATMGMALAITGKESESFELAEQFAMVSEVDLGFVVSMRCARVE